MTPYTYTLTPFTAAGGLDEAALEALLREETPQRVLVDADLFASDVDPTDRAAVIAVCCLATQHTIMLVTDSLIPLDAGVSGGGLHWRKRMLEWVNRITDLSPSMWLRRPPLSEYLSKRGWPELGDAGDWPPPHIWLAAQVSTQDDADQRLPHLARLAEAGWNTFVVAQPMLGEIWLDDEWLQMEGSHPGDALGSGIRWVICGGETGPGARGMDPGWARWLRDQCHAVGVPFWYTGDALDSELETCGVCEGWGVIPNGSPSPWPCTHCDGEGKIKGADGQEWRGLPEGMVG